MAEVQYGIRAWPSFEGHMRTWGSMWQLLRLTCWDCAAASEQGVYPAAGSCAPHTPFSTHPSGASSTNIATALPLGQHSCWLPWQPQKSIPSAIMVALKQVLWAQRAGAGSHQRLIGISYVINNLLSLATDWPVGAMPADRTSTQRWQTADGGRLLDITMRASYLCEESPVHSARQAGLFGESPVHSACQADLFGESPVHSACQADQFGERPVHSACHTDCLGRAQSIVHVRLTCMGRAQSIGYLFMKKPVKSVPQADIFG